MEPLKEYFIFSNLMKNSRSWSRCVKLSGKVSFHFKRINLQARNVAKTIQSASAFERESTGNETPKMASRGHGWTDLPSMSMSSWGWFATIACRVHLRKQFWQFLICPITAVKYSTLHKTVMNSYEPVCCCFNEAVLLRCWQLAWRGSKEGIPVVCVVCLGEVPV